MLASQPRVSDVDAPAPPSPPSPILSASQSWASGEIPIFLDGPRGTVQLSVTDTTSNFSSFLTPAGSVDTFGQPARAHTTSARIKSRQSTHSCSTLQEDDLESSSSSSPTPATALFPLLECDEQYSYGADQESVFSLSAYLASASVYGDANGGCSTVDDPPLVTQQDLLNVDLPATSLASSRKRERPKTLNDLEPLDRFALQPHRGLSLIHRREHPETDVPLSPTSTFLLSPVASSAFEHVTDPTTNTYQQRHFRAVSAPHPSIGVIHAALDSYNAQLPVPSASILNSHTRPRSNSNPHIPVPDASIRPHIDSAAESVPEWLRGMQIDLWIDQEGFRAIQPRLELVGFSHGTGINTGGETLDVVEFAMRTRQTWHFHHAPLDSAPVLRRLTVNGDMNDYISRQGHLYSNGTSTEDKGRVAWKFEYRVEDRRESGSGKIMDGEKRFTPLRFVCNPTLLSSERGKKIKLLQFVRKSVTPKLQSVRLANGSRASAAILPRIVVGERRISKETSHTRAQGKKSSDRSNVAIEQHHSRSSIDGQDTVILDRHTAPVIGQHIVSPSVLRALFPLHDAQVQVASGGPPPPPRGPLHGGT